MMDGLVGIWACPDSVDTALSRHRFPVQAFEGHRRRVAERRVTPLAVVEDLQVLADCGRSLRVRLPVGVASELELERREEAFRDGVIPAVGASAHTADHAMSSE